MVLQQEELISRYFDRSMTSAEEQNFLISLAASDAMRLAFRSHLELMKAVRDDKDRLRSVAQVRNRTFTALGLSAAAVTPFIEQELVRSAKAESTESASFGSIPGALPKPGFLSGLWHTPKFALGTGIMLGFLSAVTVMNLSMSPAHRNAADPSSSATVPSSSAARQPAASPSIQNVGQQSVATPATSQSIETIPATNDLNMVATHSSRASDAKSVATRSGQPSTVTGHDRAGAVTAVPGTPPEITRMRSSRFDVKKATIHNPANDSAQVR